MHNAPLNNRLQHDRLADPGWRDHERIPVEQDRVCGFSGLNVATVGKPGRSVWRAEGAAGWKQVEVRRRIGANITYSRIRAAEAGLGICFVPKTQLSASLQRGSLIKVLPGYRPETAGLHVVYPDRKPMPRSLAAFLEMIFASAADADRD